MDKRRIELAAALAVRVEKAFIYGAVEGIHDVRKRGFAASLSVLDRFDPKTYAATAASELFERDLAHLWDALPEEGNAEREQQFASIFQKTAQIFEQAVLKEGFDKALSMAVPEGSVLDDKKESKTFEEQYLDLAQINLLFGVVIAVGKLQELDFPAEYGDIDLSNLEGAKEAYWQRDLQRNPQAIQQDTINQELVRLIEEEALRTIPARARRIGYHQAMLNMLPSGQPEGLGMREGYECVVHFVALNSLISMLANPEIQAYYDKINSPEEGRALAGVGVKGAQVHDALNRDKEFLCARSQFLKNEDLKSILKGLISGDINDADVLDIVSVESWNAKSIGSFLCTIVERYLPENHPTRQSTVAWVKHIQTSAERIEAVPPLAPNKQAKDEQVEGKGKGGPAKGKDGK